MTVEEKAANKLGPYWKYAKRNSGAEFCAVDHDNAQKLLAESYTEVEELKAENEKLRGALEKIIDRCERGIYDATDAAFIEETARQAPTP
jgi:cell division protein FtsB